MHDVEATQIVTALTEEVKGDESQLDVILAEEPRIIVEAPAGYGKTSTMISRLAYLITKGAIPNPKKILAMTFSVNATLKMKTAIAEKLPVLARCANNPVTVAKKVLTTNYHGFCKRVLAKYGQWIDGRLEGGVFNLQTRNEKDIVANPPALSNPTPTHLDMLKEVEDGIMTRRLPSDAQRAEYLEIVGNELLPAGIITHNAIILYVIALFEQYPALREFYQNLFRLIVIDEFQDIDGLTWALVQELISDDTHLMFLGDPLQRIYGFKGALPDIMPTAENTFKMTKYALTTNHRFVNNPDMLAFERALRVSASRSFSGMPDTTCATVPSKFHKTQEGEALAIASKILELRKVCPDDSIAVLCRSRGPNTNIMQQTLDQQNINYFYGLLTEDTPAYRDFHDKCLELLIARDRGRHAVSPQDMSSLAQAVRKEYAESLSKESSSLFNLLDAFLGKVSVEYKHLKPDERYSLLIDAFQNGQLKHAMEYVESPVILTTIHGSKGLEWDYVFIPDVEPWITPYHGACSQCSGRQQNSSTATTPKCVYPGSQPQKQVDALLEDLSLLYVGVTRAKKQTFISASGKRTNNSGKVYDSRFSCLAFPHGMVERDWDS